MVIISLTLPKQDCRKCVLSPIFLCNELLIITSSKGRPLQECLSVVVVVICCCRRHCLSVGRISCFWTNEYPNILVTIDIARMNIPMYSDKNMMNEYPNKWALKKSKNIFANEYICLKYLNIFKYQNICPRLFWIICQFSYFVLFGPILKHFEPIITILNNFLETMKIQIHLL